MASESNDILNWEYNLALIKYLRASLYLREGQTVKAKGEIAMGLDILTRLARDNDKVPRFATALKDFENLKAMLPGAK